MDSAMIALIGNPVFLVRSNGPNTFSYISINAAYEAATGLQSSDIVGKPVQEIVPARQARRTVSNYEHCRETAAFHSYEELLDLADGEVWWHTTLSPCFGDDGAVTQILGNSFDITANKRKEVERIEHICRLNSEREALRNFTRLAAHNLKEPMNSISSYVDEVMHSAGGLQSETQEDLKIIRDLSAKARTSIEDMLLRMQADTYEITQQPVALGQICSDIASLIDPRRLHTISFKNLALKSDPVIMHLVLRNLINSAITHNPNRILEINVAVEERGSSLRVMVSDDGETFAKRPITYQSAYHPPDFGGRSSLGLTALQSILRSVGGEIMAAPPASKKRGTTLVAMLPGRIVSDRPKS